MAGEHHYIRTTLIGGVLVVLPLFVFANLLLWLGTWIGGKTAPVAEFARIIWEETGRDPQAFALEHLPTFDVDVVRRWPSVEKAERLLGWRAQIGVREGIRQTADWLRGVVGPAAA